MDLLHQLGLALLLTASASEARSPLDAAGLARAVEYGRGLKASMVERGLPAVRLDEWLARAVGEESLSWFVSDCDLKSNSRQPPERMLLCIGAATPDESRIDLRFHLAVGDGAQGISGKPSVLPQSFVGCNPPTMATMSYCQELWIGLCDQAAFPFRSFPFFSRS